MANVPLVVMGLPVTLKKLGTVAATLVTEPEPLLLNVFQSVLVKYPLVVALAAAMLIVGVAPPEDTTGAVPVTLVTVPTLIEPPRLVLVPLIVIAELAKPALGIVVEAVTLPVVLLAYI